MAEADASAAVSLRMGVGWGERVHLGSFGCEGVAVTTQIEAGRELDALVAVEVMGWVQRGEYRWKEPGVPLEWAAPQRHSTTGDGMLAVLERMRALGWAGSFQWDTEGFLAQFISDAVRTDGVGEADTLPHAVCLAALEAVRA